MKYLDGARYEGSFVNGKREGFGKYVWNKRKYYEGEWKQGKQEGKGYFFNRGKGVQAIWKNGNIISYLSNDNKSSNYESNNSTYTNSNNNGRILSPGYNDSIISLNQSNNSGIDKIFFRMKTTQNKYNNINYKLNDVTKSKPHEISFNSRYSYKKKYQMSNEKGKEKEKEKVKEKESEKKYKKNTSRSIKSANKNISTFSHNYNNSFITTKEKVSINRRSEVKKLNQTQIKISPKSKKVYNRKK